MSVIDNKALMVGSSLCQLGQSHFFRFGDLFALVPTAVQHSARVEPLGEIIDATDED